MTTVYIGQAITIHPPVPRSHPKFDELTSYDGIIAGTRDVFVQISPLAQPAAAADKIVGGDANGYAVAVSTVEDLAEQVTGIMQALGDGFEFSDFLYVEVEEENGRKECHRILPNGASAIVETGEVTFASDQRPVLAIPALPWEPVADGEMCARSDVLAPGAFYSVVEAPHRDGWTLTLLGGEPDIDYDPDAVVLTEFDTPFPTRPAAMAAAEAYDFISPRIAAFGEDLPRTMPGGRR